MEISRAATGLLAAICATVGAGGTYLIVRGSGETAQPAEVAARIRLQQRSSSPKACSRKCRNRAGGAAASRRTKADSARAWRNRRRQRRARIRRSLHLLPSRPRQHAKSRWRPSPHRRFQRARRHDRSSLQLLYWRNWSSRPSPSSVCKWKPRSPANAHASRTRSSPALPAM